MSKLPVLEIFGPTIQGEGSMIGVKTVFIRTLGCDFSCVWCDSAFTWDGSQKACMMEISDIIFELEKIGMDNFSHVTISGGNPALLPLEQLLTVLKSVFGKKIGLETQGSVKQDWFRLVDDLTISPKPPSSGMRFDERVLEEIICKNHNRCSLKIVVFDDEDYLFAKKIHAAYPQVAMYLQAGNWDVDEFFPQDLLVKKLLAQLSWLVGLLTNDKDMNTVRVLPQLHTLMWGNKKGV